MGDRAEAKRKELATRAALGPRLPRSPRLHRVYADVPVARLPNRGAGERSDHPTKDSR